ncbi:MAG: PPC domain-containing protein [Deltaproteobacteria bacterium]|nr:PPC domain-containing protein [Deltaproteobacteria bacterium]MBP7286225.1 PPC domain-containing protein [Nannocystaceae bacterium]
MTRTFLFASLALSLSACDPSDEDGLLELGEGDYQKGGGSGKADASVQAVVLDFEFDGSLLANSAFGASDTIESQLLYTIGHFNGDNSVGRLDKLELSDIRTEAAGDLVRIHYHAKLPVAWGRKNAVPSSYTLTLPSDATFDGLERFTDSYSHSCVDFGAHEVESGNMWYYYRPGRSGCNLAESDVVRVRADVSVSDTNTSGKYPEYDKVWEDDVLRVVAVFGKYEDGATSNTDAGISAFNEFNRAIKTELAAHAPVSVPANVGSNPGVASPDVTWSATLEDGRRVEVVSLLVDNVRQGGPAFDARYGALSSSADFMVYNGHAGLGANIRALARKGHWVRGQYALVFMNGCDTYAYVDSALADAHALVNPDDPDGTKHLDIMTNAMPSFFAEMTNGTMAIFRGLMRYDDPQTFEQIMAGIDSDEVVLVSGEHDNVFVPGGDDDDGDVVDGWAGLDERGTLARNQEQRFATPQLAAGRYVFELSGTGDADLYVRTGSEPTQQSFECRPFKSGSNESCAVELAAPAVIHVMVRGFSASSQFELSAGRE